MADQNPEGQGRGLGRATAPLGRGGGIGLGAGAGGLGRGSLSTTGAGSGLLPRPAHPQPQGFSSFPLPGFPVGIGAGALRLPLPGFPHAHQEQIVGQEELVIADESEVLRPHIGVGRGVGRGRFVHQEAPAPGQFDEAIVQAPGQFEPPGLAVFDDQIAAGLKDDEDGEVAHSLAEISLGAEGGSIGQSEGNASSSDALTQASQRAEGAEQQAQLPEAAGQQGQLEEVQEGAAAPNEELQAEAQNIPPGGAEAQNIPPGGAEAEPVAPQQPVLRLTTDPVLYRGSRGKNVELSTNFSRVIIEEDKHICEYWVTFDPPIDETRARRKVITSLRDHFGNAFAVDGQKIWLPSRLNSDAAGGDVTTYIAKHPFDPSVEINVTFRLVREATMAKAMQLYNVCFRRVLRCLNLVEIQRDYYDPSAKRPLENSKLIIWPGLITAIDEYEAGLMLCMEQTFKVLRDTSILDMYNQDYKTKPNGLKVFQQAIVGKIIMTKYNNRCYRVDEIATDQTPLSTFERTRNNVTTSVSYQQYLREQYNVEVTDLKQFIIISRQKPKKNDPLGTEIINALVPEHCVLTGLTENERSNFFLMKSIIDQSRIPPNVRRVLTNDFMTRLAGNPDAQKELNAWGMSIERENVQITARLNPGPQLNINPRFSLNPATADFTKDVTTKTIFEPVNLGKWVMFVGVGDRPKAEQFWKTYKQVIPALGIKMAHDPIIVQVGQQGRPYNTNDLRLKLREYVKKNNEDNIQFIVAILPMAKDDLYAAVKNHCVVENSMASQVILAKTLSNEKRLRSVCQKIALQINCKLDGAIWSLHVPMKEDIMFVGIDSHHCPDRSKSSILGLVASLNNGCTKLFSSVSAEVAHTEDSNKIKPLFTQALNMYKSTNGFFPSRVVVFRDGVGDGQLNTVQENEVQQLKEICKQMIGTEIKFMFVVVQKRINERFFLKRGTDLVNPEPGTFVDHTVTRRNYSDFFLVSQLVRQGTVSPTHYIVMDDSGENKPDLAQRFAFALTFMYFNWPGTIRVPAMCQYAHKLAMLTGQHLTGLPNQKLDTNLWYL